MVRGVRVRVVEDVEWTLALRNQYAQCLPRFGIKHRDPEPTVVLAPQQSDLDAVGDAAIEFAEAGTSEPVEELERFVYAEGAPT